LRSAGRFTFDGLTRRGSVRRREALFRQV
jgi:hypothetical protein